MKQQQAYKVGVYCRLSRDDETNSESVSISTQKAMITKYAQENGWEIIDYYVDDGVSGVTFQRPDFIRMIEDIDRKRINMVITKDLSRLGRDYILTGHYVEVYFPSKDCRYIAINDGIDTIHDNNDIAPFKAIINEFYAKDASKKIRSAIKTKAQLGYFMGSYAPYGYMKDPNDCHKLLVDEEAAAVVRRIYRMFLQGAGIVNIARTLTYEGVDTPMQHLMKKNPEMFKSPKWQGQKLWAHCVVNKILKNIMYLGHMVNGRQTTRSFKCQEIIRNAPSDWIVVENTHEPIVSQEDFDEVQRLAEFKRKPTKEGTPHIFSGLLRCDECGKGFSLTNNHSKQKYFRCRTYHFAGKNFCSNHNIRYDILVNAIHEDIKYHAELAKFNKDAILSKLLSEDNTGRQGRINGCRNEISKISSREIEIESVFKNLYEDKVKGTINDSRFIFLTQQYDEELETLINRKKELQDLLAKEEIGEKDTTRFMALIEKYVDMQELTSEVAHELIDRIYIGKREGSGSGKEATQEVKIVYKFVGEIAA